uniref:Uncharacterized protein n=1 Tax=Candidatus Kentrum sp. MB TaxID=2138164 RepID=A0A450XWB5_9GAMM|nr:MAG: hypothetical protein BECKMB1821G_GA0114241_10234 [Candidatus Kentron sp. MB]VFK33568.1 MAG: hypothetical protein BECKMB1821I_GA0114274_104813 [Candidatus Kentron sp. MB]VFK76692.1 MAG: hypothetical protein BECKMB1821H_GA0114242_106910 [Candidatus Kentron sp. MB]
MNSLATPLPVGFFRLPIGHFLWGPFSLFTLNGKFAADVHGVKVMMAIPLSFPAQLR